MLCGCHVQHVAMHRLSAPLVLPDLCLLTVRIDAKCPQVSQIASLLLADIQSPAFGTSTMFDHQSAPDHQQITVYRPSTDVAPIVSNAAVLSLSNTSPISSVAGSDSTADSRIFEWQVWP